MPTSVVLGFVFVFLLRVMVAIGYPNMLWPDEIFQTLEPAHRLAYGNGIVTWEYRVGTRSWVLPGLLAGVMRLTDWMGPGSVGYLAGVKLFLCLLSMSTVLFAFLWAYRVSGMPAAMIALVVSGLWFELIYYSPKAFFEVVAAHLLLPGVYLGQYGGSFHPRTRMLLAGLFYGCALALRINLAPAIAVAAVYSCGKDWRDRWAPMIIGILVPQVASGLVDSLTWSYPFQSVVLNLWINAVQGKSTYYGVSPWYFYLWWLTKRLGPIAVLAVLGVRRSPLLGWLVLVLVLSHSLLGHKEYRFIYPAIPLIITLAVLGMDELGRLVRRRFSPTWATALVTGCLLLSVAASVVLASHYRGDYEFRGSTGAGKLNWTQFGGNLRAAQELSKDDAVCGVGLWGLGWAASGGYAYLHRDVPIFQLTKDTDFAQSRADFNYLVSTVAGPPQESAYRLLECWGPTCVYRRSGPCAAVAGYSINKVLEQKGQ